MAHQGGSELPKETLQSVTPGFAPAWKQVLTEELEAHYPRLLEDYARCVRLAGADVAVKREGAPYFGQLEHTHKERVLFNLVQNIEAFQTVLAKGEDIADDRVVLWRMLTRLKWHPEPRLFDHLRDGDMIEIYDLASMVQLFRSFSFFKVCSYTLDEILCRPWWDLFERDQTAFEQIMDVVNEFFEARCETTIYYNLGRHMIKEIDSPAQLCWMGENKCLSPLFKEGKIVGLVNVVRAHSRLDGGGDDAQEA